MRANSTTDVSITTAVDGSVTGPAIDQSVAPIESWTLTFVSSTEYDVSGSVTGDDGRGDTGFNFVSTSGAITIPSSYWSGTWTEGDQVTFLAVMNYPVPVGTEGNIFTAALAAFNNASDLTLDDFNLSSWGELISHHARHTGVIVERRKIDALTFLRKVMRHAPATGFPDADGKISVGYFRPQLAATVFSTFCGTYSLMSLEAERLKAYSSVVVEYDPDDDGDPQKTRRWPAPGIGPVGNRPLEVELPYFNDGDETIIDFVLQRYYALFNEDREIFETELWLDELNIALDAFVYVESLRPARQVFGQIIGFDKDLLSPTIRCRLLDVSWLFQTLGQCGFGFCDVGHYTDGCWVAF